MKLFSLAILFYITLFQQSHKSTVVFATSYSIKGKTASGQITSKIKEPFLAISRDLIDEYPIGTKVVLSKCKWAGQYKVLDKMGRRHRKMVDIYSNKKNTGIVKCNCQISKNE
jgi:3D (Asp-Asp-Asp) domain-containing protein